MKSVIYTSKCKFPEFDVHDLDIFRTARSHNATVGIHGFLYRTKAHYFQYIDGPDREINNLVNRLFADKRHSDISIIKEEQIRFTRFPSWSMGYSRDEADRSQPSIDPTCSSDEVFEFLLNEANSQIQIMKAKEKGSKVPVSIN